MKQFFPAYGKPGERVLQIERLGADPANHLLMHAMTSNISGVIGSAAATGILLGFLG